METKPYAFDTSTGYVGSVFSLMTTCNQLVENKVSDILSVYKEKLGGYIAGNQLAIIKPLPNKMGMVVGNGLAELPKGIIRTILYGRHIDSLLPLTHRLKMMYDHYNTLGNRLDVRYYPDMGVTLVTGTCKLDGENTPSVFICVLNKRSTQELKKLSLVNNLCYRGGLYQTMFDEIDPMTIPYQTPFDLLARDLSNQHFKSIKVSYHDSLLYIASGPTNILKSTSTYKPTVFGFYRDCILSMLKHVLPAINLSSIDFTVFGLYEVFRILESKHYTDIAFGLISNNIYFAKVAQYNVYFCINKTGSIELCIDGRINAKDKLAVLTKMLDWNLNLLRTTQQFA